MNRPQDLDAMIWRARDAVRGSLFAERAHLDRALTEQTLYVAANRYAVVGRQARRGESSQELLRTQQRALGEAALHYAHARGWQPPADWEPPAAAGAD